MCTKINLEEHYVRNTSSYHVTRHIDYPWNKKKFKKHLKINVIKCDKECIEFDLIEINTAFANAFRRVLLAEVPCMAIEKVFMYNNTSVMQDEVLAHRLGLIPLKADAREFQFPTVILKDPTKSINDDEEEDDNFPENETLQFELKVKYTQKHNHPKDPITKSYNCNKILSKHFNWIPLGDQANKYKENDVGPVCDDIVITKLAPGTEIHAKLFAFKGIGKDHAKFQTVGTAFYRLMPEITLLEEFTDQKAELLKSCFSPGVIEIIKDEDGTSKAKVACARYDSGSRNIFRYNIFKDSVKVERIPNHFIFTIESVGAYEPNVLFLEAIKVLENKCDRFINELKGNIKSD